MEIGRTINTVLTHNVKMQTSLELLKDVKRVQEDHLVM